MISTIYIHIIHTHAILRLCVLDMLFIKQPKMLKTRSFVVLLCTYVRLMTYKVEENINFVFYDAVFFKAFFLSSR